MTPEAQEPRAEPVEPAAAAPAPQQAEAGEQSLILLPLRDTVVFPEVVLPITVGRAKGVRALQEAVRSQQPIGVVLQRDPEVEDPGPAELHPVGTLVHVLRYVSGEERGHHAVCQGQRRFRILEFLSSEPYLRARCDVLEDDPRAADSKEVEARALTLKEQAREALGLMPGVPPELAQAVQSISDPSALADMIATFLDVPAAEKQEVLETIDVAARLELVGRKLGHLVEVLQLSQSIREQTKGSLDRAQREYYLRQQLETIQKELGIEDERSAEVAEVERAIERAAMPPEVDEHARRELARLERMPPGAAESTMLRTYLDVLTDLPWSRATDDQLDLERAERVLDEDHYGLEKVKQRILEFLAVLKLKPDRRAPILCLVGPPGTGKTSLGQSIARALGREFARISLGGIHDEAEIRGHRRTYIGAMPGRIVQALRRAGSRNPVFMLDEMDKLGAGFHGDPSAALLEVLDPAQNSTFRDSYLDVPFDLSRVFFIATANLLELIPGPLRDRMEVIELRGYTEDEKLEIAKRYQVGRQLEQSGLQPEQCRISDDALREIVRYYTREAGCRNLERAIASVCRRVATRVAREEVERVEVGPAEVREILGPRRFEGEVAQRTSVAGVATGLAWTPVGGEILFVEATRMPGNGRFVLTGQLGEVMKESAQAALSLIKSHADSLGLEPSVFERSDVHVHVPAGAIPKDGPSAGVTMYVALVSLFTGRQVKSDVAMTGEISLRGLVLPVGGIRDKVLAALAAGLKTVLLPQRNEKDLEDVPDAARDRLDFVWLETVDQAVDAALEPPVDEPRAGA